MPRRDSAERRERRMGFRHRHWLALLTGLAAAGSLRAQIQAPADVMSQLSEAPPAPLSEPSDAPGLGVDWRIPPVLMSGSVSYDLRSSRGHDEPNTISQLVTTELNARSYIYQPWYATVNGTLRLTTGRSRSSGFDDPSQGPFASQEPHATKDRFVTGAARMDVFPLSRFPFEVHVERSDSRIDNALASSIDFRSQNIGFSQRYRPLTGGYTLGASFDRREQIAAGVRDTQNVLGGDFATRWKHNDLSLGLSLSQAVRDATDERTQFSSLVARHMYSPASALSVDTTVNWTQTDEHLIGPATNVSVLQLSSVGLWRPDGSKLTLSGAVRSLLLRDSVTGNGVDTFGVTLGASYELNRNARLTANAGASLTNSNGNGATAVGGSVGASWQGDTREFSGFRYDWFASGNASASAAHANTSPASGAGTAAALTPVLASVTDSGNQTQTSLGVQIGHTLNRPWQIAPQSVLVLSATQSLAASQNQGSHVETGSTPTTTKVLVHSLGATWNANGDNRTGYARASYSDSAELGGTGTRFQLFNFQLSGNFQFDRFRSLAGDLTMQRTKQRIGNQTDLGPGAFGPVVLTSSSGASGEITYLQQRPFGFSRLRFSSRLKLAQDVLNQPGAFATIPDRETRLWENRLDWLVGRLETQLIFRISRIDGRRRDLLMWRVQRSFGN